MEPVFEISEISHFEVSKNSGKKSQMLTMIYYTVLQNSKTK
jgi:hypothetical protein